MGDAAERVALDALMVQTANRERQAFRALYTATSRKLFAVLINILGDETEASDVLQDVYITVWNRADRFDAAKGTAIAWLSVITRNAGIDALRRRRPGHVSDEFVDLQPSIEPTPFDHLLENDVSDALGRRLKQLPAAQQDAIRLFYLEENSLAEISVKLDTPINTVKSWVRRGVANLRHEFQGESIREFI